MATTVITITHTQVAADLAAELRSAQKNPKHMAQGLERYACALAGGLRNGTSIDVSVSEAGGTAATGTIIFSGTGAASDTILINGVTFTARASGATGNEWNVGGTATLSGAALAAAINASATSLVSGIVSAASVTGTVTISARKKGLAGNAVTIAEGVDGSSHMAVSGARLTGGTATTANSFNFSA